MFRGVNFRLTKINTIPNEILKEIPHFRFIEEPQKISKSFDLKEFWQLECVEKGRVLSEATGRLLLGTLIQINPNLAVFVRVGESFSSEKYIGYSSRPCEYFETFPSAGFSESSSSDVFVPDSAQVVLEWFPSNLRLNFPGFSGYFDSVHPIERIQVCCIWPQIPRAGLQFKRDDLQGAPIWIVEYEESEDAVHLRNKMLRSIQAEHLREVLFTPTGEAPLISIQASRDGKFLPKTIDTINLVWETMAQVYRAETEKLEKDSSFRYNFIPKRVTEVMRYERIHEAFSLIWRRFVGSVERSWNELKLIPFESDLDRNIPGEIENSILLINWCIQRELEWQGSLKDHVLLRKLYRIPERYLYQVTETVTDDEKIEQLKEKLETGLADLGRTLSGDTEHNSAEFSDEFVDCADESDDADPQYVRNVLKLDYDLKGHVVYEPVTLNCEPPPNKFLTRSLLKNPMAGDVIAVNQLKEDMRVFKAWNEEICGVQCILEDGGILNIGEHCSGAGNVVTVTIDLGFVGFLFWHSPNDVELKEGQLVISQRMRDSDGQWLKMWTEDSKIEIDDESNVPVSFSRRVSFNHRALLGQVMSDLTLKTDLRLLLESGTPWFTRKAAELLGNEAQELLDREEQRARSEGDGAYPLDAINLLLDEHESKLAKSLTLQALCPDIFSPADTGKISLVAGEAQREFLLNAEQHDFTEKRKEIVGREGGFRELLSGFEAIRIKLPY